VPNTLAHFGVQGPLTRATGVHVDAKWILLGCVLPDVPWIARRGIAALAGGAVDPVALRLYAIVQASLLFSLVLAGALALLSGRPRVVFGVLGAGALLHLLLDALQTKWGNGVHLLAPASWETLNVGLFWPESVATVALTLAGVGYLAWEWRRGPSARIPLAPGPRGAAGALLLAALYLGTPPLFFGGVLASGSHSLASLEEVEERPGRTVELDRVGYTPGRAGEGSGTLTVTGGELRAAGRLPDGPATISVRGVFADRRTLRVTDYHVHEAGGRALASGLGLALLAAAWARDLARTDREGTGR